MVTHFVYAHVIKPILFKFDPESVHSKFTTIAERIGSSPWLTAALETIFNKKTTTIAQMVAGIRFESPVGLAAGFDYEACLTQILPAMGFGFHTVGTITNLPYEGNVRPMLGRLPKSRSLMVNKGFKNLGANATAKKLTRLSMSIPLGVSIGRTNNASIATQRDAVDDILQAFRTFESSTVQHRYYELNISCPNLHGGVTFYPSHYLEELLTAIDSLRLQRPVFVKMPIEKTNDEILAMLEVIARHSPVGVIFGNLQKDRQNPTLNQNEVAHFPVGNFSGKPTYDRSNELISLAYKNYSDRFIIIGCGGVFSAQDAYEKITRGATLIQFITGLIFEGPQLASEINQQLPTLLERDGFSSISEAIGTHV